MWKKTVYSIICAGLLLTVGFVSAQVTIPNPLRYNNFGQLLLNGIIPGVAGLVGALSVIMIIVAGIFYLTSAGSPERIGTAKKALIYAVVGIVIVLISGAIVLTIKSILGVP